MTNEIKSKKINLLTPTYVGGVPEVSPEQLDKVRQSILLIDCRRPEEFNNELGHVPGAVLVPLGPELTDYLAKLERNLEIVMICRSGNRSGHATLEALEMGFVHVYNLTGGMLLWNDEGLTVERK